MDQRVVEMAEGENLRQMITISHNAGSQAPLALAVLKGFVITTPGPGPFLLLLGVVGGIKRTNEMCCSF